MSYLCTRKNSQQQRFPWQRIETKSQSKIIIMMQQNVESVAIKTYVGRGEIVPRPLFLVTVETDRPSSRTRSQEEGFKVTRLTNNNKSLRLRFQLERQGPHEINSIQCLPQRVNIDIRTVCQSEGGREGEEGEGRETYEGHNGTPGLVAERQWGKSIVSPR